MSRKLWKHQKYAVDKYKNKKFCGILFPCGCGKTLTAIALAEEKERPVLIIAPNALCEQWKEEIADKSEKTGMFLSVLPKQKIQKVQGSTQCFVLRVG